MRRIYELKFIIARKFLGETVSDNITAITTTVWLKITRSAGTAYTSIKGAFLPWGNRLWLQLYKLKLLYHFTTVMSRKKIVLKKIQLFKKTA